MNTPLTLHHPIGKLSTDLLDISFARSTIYSLSDKLILISIKSILLRQTLHETDERRGIEISFVGCY